MVGRHEGHVRRPDQAVDPGRGRGCYTAGPMPAAIAYAALLRAVNVGGTGKLAMTDLARLCEREGLCDVKTYIQSGNVVFTSPKKEAAGEGGAREDPRRQMGKPVPVMVRTVDQLEATIAANPFPEVAVNRLLITFFDEPLAKAALAGVVAPGGELAAIRGPELFIHYPDGMGVSKLKVPALMKAGTGRNLNTVVKLTAMTRGSWSSLGAYNRGVMPAHDIPPSPTARPARRGVLPAAVRRAVLRRLAVGSARSATSRCSLAR